MVVYDYRPEYAGSAGSGRRCPLFGLETDTPPVQCGRYSDNQPVVGQCADTCRWSVECCCWKPCSFLWITKQLLDYPGLRLDSVLRWCAHCKPSPSHRQADQSRKSSNAYIVPCA